MAGAGAIGRCAVCAQIAQGPQLLHALLPRIRAHFGVEGRALLPDLAHITQDQGVRARQVGQHLDGRTDRIGVGVVGVVDERDGLAGVHTGQHPRASRHRFEHRQAGGHRLQRCAHSQCRRGSRHGVVQVVAARQAQLRPEFAHRRVDVQGPGLPFPAGLPDHLGRHRQGGLCRIALHLAGKAPHACPAGQLRPQGRIGVFSRKDRGATRRQGLQHRSVFAGHRFNGVHEFLVFALRVVHHRHRGLRHGGQLLHLAGVVHAQLQDRCLVPAIGAGAQRQHRQRHADVVVQIALGVACPLAAPGAQDGGGHLGHGGLAVAAGHGNHGQRQLGTPSTGQRLQAEQAVGHRHPGQASAGQAAFGQHRHRTAVSGLAQEIMAIEALTAKGHKQVARLQGSGIGVHPADDGAGITVQHRGAAHTGGHVAQGHEALSRPGLQARPHHVDIAKRMAGALKLLIGLMALAGHQHHVPVGRLLQGVHDGAAPVHLAVHRDTRRPSGTHVVQDALRVLAARVVAGQHHAVGAASGHGAHQGALGAVAVTATAEDTPQATTPLLCDGAQRRQGLFQGVGRVRVIHHGQRFTGPTLGLQTARHRRKLRQDGCDVGQGMAQRAQAGHHPQKVQQVVVPQEGHVHGQPAHRAGWGLQAAALCRRFVQFKAHAGGCGLNTARLQPGRFSQAHGPQVQRGPLRAQLCMQGGATRVVHVDHRG